MPNRFEERMAEHHRRYLRRLGALRAAVRLPGGREHLRMVRRAARPRQPSPRRYPALILVAAFVLVLLLVVIAERASGATLGGAPCSA